MKIKYLIITVIAFCSFECFAQDASQVAVHDTRALNEGPSNFGHIVRFDFKSNPIIGIPSSAPFSGVMTLAPWGDATGGENHQLGFNANGLFYRSGSHDETSWNGWKKIAMANEIGVVQADAGSGSLQLKPGIADHTYMEFYARSANPSLRSAWFGYGEPGSNDLILRNEATGNVNILTTNGNVGIGTYNPTDLLTVAGKIGAREIKVSTTAGADFVFEPTYELPNLVTLEKYVKANKHLPEIPTAKEMVENGVNLGELNIKLLQKIEELTLHVIELSKENQEIKKKLNIK